MGLVFFDKIIFKVPQLPIKKHSVSHPDVFQAYFLLEVKDWIL